MAGILNPSTVGNSVKIAPALNLLLSDSTNTNKATAKITLDPITRIEGHLRIDTQVKEGVITDAWSSATLFRGIELILAGRDPRDAPLITQRLCGVCTYVHLQASSVAIENSMQLTVPVDAQIVRNLINGTQFLHDHIVHFYHLHALDWVDVTAAIKADPNATQTLARQISPAAPAMDFAAVKAKLQSLVDSGQLGPFAAGYWGHSAYKLSPEANLLFVAHYLQALRQQADTAKMMALFAGKNPHPHAVAPGGITSGAEIYVAANMTSFSSLLTATNDFINQFYIPDVVYLAGQYPEYAKIGGFENMLAYGEFPLDTYGTGNCLLPGGVILNKDVANVAAVNLADITEDVSRAWYTKSTPQNPTTGVTSPSYTGYDQNADYSWLKAPRYQGKPMEVGPLARVLVAYGKGQTQVKAAVDSLLSTLGLTMSDMFSVLGRTAARAIETQVIGQAMTGWLTTLQNNIKAGNTATFTGKAVPANVTGIGIGEAPRGAVGHWFSTDGSAKIKNYQMVVPSAWNFGPRDAKGLPSAVEAALVGVPIADSTQPLEILRLVHSYDPCIACGVHLIDAQGNPQGMVKIG
ncbi:nickel-dependent hydrogenase large subunit [Desulfovibrio sp. TomC]|uniref:nickel-dependent hydrogenase large subunit n=1 Tax=Desulfovibrio sp. TomC TaxID=1562888 RepID=UPI000574A4F8|nr:nickel-dependent hydrogenase large subunit [Desulfovibrio sp. TomC]KHK04407.1 [Ni/Fe] hydrogenase, group 1, large subunit [Desulfovibrio sp. TomC]